MEYQVTSPEDAVTGLVDSPLATLDVHDVATRVLINTSPELVKNDAIM